MPLVADPLMTDPVATPPSADPATPAATTPAAPTTPPVAASPDPRDLLEQAKNMGQPVNAKALATAIRAMKGDRPDLNDAQVIKLFADKYPDLGMGSMQYSWLSEPPAAQTQSAAQPSKELAPSADLPNALLRGSLLGGGQISDMLANTAHQILAFPTAAMNWATGSQMGAYADPYKRAEPSVAPLRQYAEQARGQASTLPPPAGLPANILGAAPQVVATVLPYMTPELDAESLALKGGPLALRGIRAVRAATSPGVRHAVGTGAKMATVEAVRASNQGPEASAKAAAMGAALGAVGFPLTGKVLEAAAGRLPPGWTNWVPDVVKRFASGAIPAYGLEQTNADPQDKKLANAIAYGIVAMPGGKKPTTQPGEPGPTEPGGPGGPPPPGTPPEGPGGPGGPPPGSPPGGPATPPAAGGPSAPGAPPAAGKPLSERAQIALDILVKDFMRDPGGHKVTKAGIANDQHIAPDSGGKVWTELRQAGVIDARDRLIVDSQHVQSLIPTGWMPPAPAGAKPKPASASLPTAEQKAAAQTHYNKPAETATTAATDTTAADEMKARVAAAASVEQGAATGTEQAAATTEPEKPVEAAAGTGEVDTEAAARAAAAESDARVVELRAQLQRIQEEKAAAAAAAAAALAAGENPPAPPTPPTPPETTAEVQPEPPAAQQATGAEPKFRQLPRIVQEQIATRALLADGEVRTVGTQDIENAINEMIGDEGRGARSTREMLRAMGGPDAEKIYDQHLGLSTVTPSGEKPFYELPLDVQHSIATEMLRHQDPETPNPDLLDVNDMAAEFANRERENPERSTREFLEEMGGKGALDLYDQHVANPANAGVDRVAEADAANARKALDDTLGLATRKFERLARKPEGGVRESVADVLRRVAPELLPYHEEYKDQPAATTQITKEQADASRQAILGHVKAFNNAMRKSGTRGSISWKAPTPEPGELPTSELIGHLKNYGRYLLQQGTKRFLDWRDAMVAQFGGAIEAHLMPVWQSIMERGPGVAGLKTEAPVTAAPPARRTAAPPTAPEVAEQFPPPGLGASGPRRARPPFTPEVTGEPVTGPVASTPAPATLRLRSGKVITFPAAGLPEGKPAAVLGTEMGEPEPGPYAQTGGAAQSRLAIETANRLGVPLGKVHEIPAMEGGRPLAQEFAPTQSPKDVTDAMLAARERAVMEKGRPEAELQAESAARDAARKARAAAPEDVRKAEAQKQEAAAVIEAVRRRESLDRPRVQLSDVELENRQEAARAARDERLRAEASPGPASEARSKALRAAGEALGTGLTPPAGIPKSAPLPEPLPQGALQAGGDVDLEGRAGEKVSAADYPLAGQDILKAAGFQQRNIFREYQGTDRPHEGGKRPEIMTPTSDPEARKTIARKMPLSGEYAAEVWSKPVADGVIEVQRVPGVTKFSVKDAKGKYKRDLVSDEFVATKYYRDGEVRTFHGSGLDNMRDYLSGVMEREVPIPVSQATSGAYGGGTPVRTSKLAPETEMSPGRQELLTKLSPPPEVAGERKLTETAKAGSTEKEVSSLFANIGKRAAEQAKVRALPTEEQRALNVKRDAEIAEELGKIRKGRLAETPDYAMDPEEKRVAEAAALTEKKLRKEKLAIKRVEQPELPAEEKNAAAAIALGKTPEERQHALDLIHAQRLVDLPPEDSAAKAAPEPQPGPKFVPLPKESPFTVKEHFEKKAPKPVGAVQEAFAKAGVGPPKKKLTAGTYQVVAKFTPEQVEQQHRATALFGGVSAPTAESKATQLFGAGAGEVTTAAPPTKSPGQIAAEKRTAARVANVVKRGVMIRTLDNGKFEVKVGSGRGAIGTFDSLRAAKQAGVQHAESMLKDEEGIETPGYEWPGKGTYRPIGDGEGQAEVKNKKSGEMQMKTVAGKRYEFTPAAGGQVHTGWMPMDKWYRVQLNALPLTTAPPAKPAANPQ